MSKDGARLEREIDAFADLIADEGRDDFWGGCTDFAAEGQSPIESLMGAALYYALHSKRWFGQYNENYCWYGLPEDKDFIERVPKRGGIEVQPQGFLGKYRPDFLVMVASWNGGYVWGAIECDGHDHHNLTKEQAQHDRERDRFFQSQNVMILRYTGSEIWAGPLKCATDAIKTLLILAQGETARRWKAD